MHLQRTMKLRHIDGLLIAPTQQFFQEWLCKLPVGDSDGACVVGSGGGLKVVLVQ
jgi:hypothetical protein